MSDDLVHNKLVNYFNNVGKATAVIAGLIGIFALTGWLFDITTFKSVWPAWATMKPNTAIALILSSISIALYYESKHRPISESIAQLCSFVVLLIGGLTLTEYVTGWDLGIDHLFFNSTQPDTEVYLAGRMLPLTAINFVLIGFTTWLIPSRSTYAWHRYLIAVVILTSSFSLLAYLYNVLQTPDISSRILPFNGTIAFLLLSIAIWLARPEKGLVKILLSNSIGGYLLRRILPTAILLPVIVSIAHLVGQHYGLYSLEFSTAFFVLFITLAFVIVLWLVTHRLDSMDVVKQQLEQRVQERTAQLETSNKELEAFSYSVSHDLRTPLRAIAGFSQALQEDYEKQLDAQAQEYLRCMRTGVMRMGQLIDDVIQLSRVSRTDISKEQVNLSELATEITALLQKSNPQHVVKVAITPHLTAQGDPRLLRIALENLLSNAWKFTSKTATAQIYFDAIIYAGKPTFLVRDNGVGFDMKYANKLFQAFQRLHKDTDFPGDGIGLATVARIIGKHGGTVWAESQPNQGATFFFTL
jgi:signal transduction histidine kinase